MKASVFLIATRCRDDRAVPVIGSVRALCSRCRHDVWLSPSSVAVLQQQRPREWMEIVCRVCITDSVIGAET